MPSTPRPQPLSRPDHGFASPPWHTTGWQPPPPVIKCARTTLPAQHWIPMSNINPDPFTTRTEIEGTFGVGISTHWIATALYVGIMDKGVNANDACCATAFTVQLVKHHFHYPGAIIAVKN